MIKNILSVTFIVVFVLMWFRYFEWHSIFFPSKEFYYTPQTFSFKYDDIFFTTKDGLRIHAWFIPTTSADSYTVLFSHGNGGNISHRLTKIAILNKLGLNVFIYDYRGYGRSEGKPSENGIYLDVEAAYEYLVKEKDIPVERIIAYGESLGSAVSVNLASKVRLKALILEGVFSSAKDMAKEIYPFLPSFIIRSRFDSLSKIKNITIPKLFIHSANDEIVPVELSRKVYNVCSGFKSFLILQGGHNTSFIDSEKEFRQGITSFIDKVREIH